MTKIALLLALAASPAFAQDPDPVYQMIDGIGFCMLGEGKADTTAALAAEYGWTAEVDAEMGVTTLRPPAGSIFVMVSNDVGYCHIESAAIGTSDAETAFSLFMMGGNTGIEITAEGPAADGCLQKTLSTGAVAMLTSGGLAPVCEAEGTSAWHFTFTAG